MTMPPPPGFNGAPPPAQPAPGPAPTNTAAPQAAAAAATPAAPGFFSRAVSFLKKGTVYVWGPSAFYRGPGIIKTGKDIGELGRDAIGAVQGDAKAKEHLKDSGAKVAADFATAGAVMAADALYVGRNAVQGAAHLSTKIPGYENNKLKDWSDKHAAEPGSFEKAVRSISDDSAAETTKKLDNVGQPPPVAQQVEDNAAKLKAAQERYDALKANPGRTTALPPSAAEPPKINTDPQTAYTKGDNRVSLWRDPKYGQNYVVLHSTGPVDKIQLGTGNKNGSAGTSTEILFDKNGGKVHPAYDETRSDPKKGIYYFRDFGDVPPRSSAGHPAEMRVINGSNGVARIPLDDKLSNESRKTFFDERAAAEPKKKVEGPATDDTATKTAMRPATSPRASV
jgi:hypothetical protein